MKEEDIIKRCGNENPFKVPEGYFEKFTEELMQQLPEEKPKQTISMWQRVKPWIYMAAMFAGVIGSARLFLGTPVENTPQENESYMSSNEIIPEEAIDTLIEYAIVDDYLLYRYLTDAE